MNQNSKYFKMTAEEYIDAIKRKEIPVIEWDDFGKTSFDYFVIVPYGKVHESGWGAFCIVAFRYRNNGETTEPVGAFVEWHDVIDLDGIAGRGLFDCEKKCYKPLEAHGWSIDMLPSGLVRVFCNQPFKMIGNGLSCFEVFAIERSEE